MGLELRCFISHPRAAAGHLSGYAEHLSRSAVRVRCVHASGAATLLPQPGDHIQVYVELPAQRLDCRRCLYCIATVTNTPATPDGGLVIAASIEEMQFRDLPARFSRGPALEAASRRTQTM
jgi:hypothetical protein